MKTLIQSIALAAALAAPAMVFAQTNAPVTRAQVKADLVQFEQAGGPRSFSHDPYYPSQAQATQARIEAQNGTSQAIGGVNGGSSNSGARVAAGAAQGLYFGR